MNTWFLSIMFGAAFNVQISGTTSGTMFPVQMQKFGPISQEQCLQTAAAMGNAPGFHVQCESGSQIMISIPR